VLGSAALPVRRREDPQRANAHYQNKLASPNCRGLVFATGAIPQTFLRSYVLVHTAPGLEDFWQLHRSAAGGADHNSPEQFLANLNEVDHGHYIKMSVRPDGSFTMTNERNGFTKNYPATSKNRLTSAKQ
jgi:hypothetical protein